MLASAGGLGLLHAASLSIASGWWLQLGVFGLFALLLDQVRSGSHNRHGVRAAALGFAFGMGWFVAGICWLFISMHRYGGMPAPLEIGRAHV